MKFEGLEVVYSQKVENSFK